MHKLLQSIRKEWWLLSRDMGGLVILFVMPLVLIITITSIQDSSFQTIQSRDKTPILLVDNDGGELSKVIQENLDREGNFEIISAQNGAVLTEEAAQQIVFSGKHQLAIVIPENMSSDLEKKIAHNVNKILSEFGMESEGAGADTNIAPKEIRLYFDPATQQPFKSAVKNGIEKMISQIETQSIYKAFQKELGDEDTPLFDDQKLIYFKEVNPQMGNKEVIPNSAQHNVPAWTLFAMFFIVIPLSINLVKEKNQGTSVRLRTNPVSYATVLGGKTATYLIVCLIQFSLMLAVGVFLFPKMGLPMLELTNYSLFYMFIVALFSGLAATGFGILLGTLANTQEQSAPFGATAVVILAAIGGVWIPVFIMPKFMQTLAHISPMNWGLNAFQDVLLRQGGFMEILPEISLLLLFFLGTVTVSIIYDETKRAV